MILPTISIPAISLSTPLYWWCSLALPGIIDQYYGEVLELAIEMQDEDALTNKRRYNAERARKFYHAHKQELKDKRKESRFSIKEERQAILNWLRLNIDHI